MKINFYLKEEDSLEDEDYVTITIVRKGKERHQSANAKKLDDLTAIEQQNIKLLIATIEKYSSGTEGAKELTYSL
jgi:hypothetical protein